LNAKRDQEISRRRGGGTAGESMPLKRKSHSISGLKKGKSKKGGGYPAMGELHGGGGEKECMNRGKEKRRKKKKINATMGM